MTKRDIHKKYSYKGIDLVMLPQPDNSDSAAGEIIEN